MIVEEVVVTHFEVKEIKLSLQQAVEACRFCETSRLPDFIDNRLTDVGEVSALRACRHFYPPGRFLVLISFKGRVDPRAIVRLEGLNQLKNSKTSSGIETENFRPVA
jgi:hypothetical protein